VKHFQDWLATPAGRVVTLIVLGAYLNAAFAVAAPRAQTQQTVIQSAVPGEEYRVGPGDRLFLSIPARQDLNRELAIDEKGKIALPLVGEVTVAGLTRTEIESRLLQALREYYPSIKAIEVTVTRAISNVIFVSGDVRIPGKYSFADEMTVWEAIREAGGPTASAVLAGVRVVEDRSQGGQSYIVDVQNAIDTGSIDKLPALKPGDTVLVPTKQEVYTGSSGVNVFGAVVRPGAYPMAARQDLMSALMVAGGPGPGAKTSKITIIRPEGEGKAQVIKINLNDFVYKGDMKNNPRIYPGDTVYIAHKTFSAANVSLILGFITAIGTIVLLYYTIQNEVQANQRVR